MTDNSYILMFLTATFGLYMLGVIATLVLPRKTTPAILLGFGSLGSLTLLACGVLGLLRTTPLDCSLWSIANIGTLSLTIDHLASFFLLVTALVAIPASVFAAGHTQRNQHQDHPVLVAIYLVLLASIVLVLTAANVFLLVVAWEIMSISIYLLISNGTKDRSAYLMLAIGEAGTLAVLIAFLLLAQNAHSLAFTAIKANITNPDTSITWVIFILSFFGFGVKAGIIPLNFWLTKAYTASPGAFIPLIAGATLNLGLYGIIRVNMYILPINQAGMGIIILITGAITALIGILYATIEDDFKTLLAHSSIENAGIITTALGAGMLFIVTDHRVAAAMAFIAAFYHILNHSIFKTLLFMGAGTLENATQTRSLNQLGGVLKRMPRAGFFVLIGTMAIASMPPFNGFVSEWLTLESLLRSVELASLGIKIAFIVAGVLLALTAGLAVTCFVRSFAMAYLGMPRSNNAKKATEAGKLPLISMALLSLLCLLSGILPTYIIPAIDTAVKPLTGTSGTAALVPPFFNNNTTQPSLPKKFVAEFHNLGAQIGRSKLPGRGLVVMHRGGKENPVVFAMSTSYMFVMFIFLAGIGLTLVWLISARYRKVKYQPRWDGGVKHFLPQMTYTATGFAQPVRVIFEAILRPHTLDHNKTIAEHFRITIHRRRTEIHLIDRLVLYPLATTAQKIATILARIHSGKVNTYTGYVLLTLLLLLIIASAF